MTGKHCKTATYMNTDGVSDRTRGSSILWRLYVEFEIRTGHLQQAKKLLFRAVRECPLVKGMWAAFIPGTDVLTPRLIQNSTCWHSGRYGENSAAEN